MENEVKCVRTLPVDYTPVYLIDRRSPGPMAVILFVAAFFIDILLVAFPIVLGGVEFTLAVPGLIDTPKQLAFLAAVLLGMLLMWNLHELVRGFQGETLKIPFSPHGSGSQHQRILLDQKDLLCLFAPAARSVHRRFFYRHGLHRLRPVFLDVSAVPASQPAGLLSSGERRHGSS